MSLTINDIEEFVHILKEHPEWRQRIVHVLFNGNVSPMRDAIDRLAEQVQLLTEQVRRLTERMNQTEQRIEEGFKQVNERVDRLEQRVDEGFKQVDERFNRLEQRVDHLEQRFDRLEQRVDEGFKQVDERFKQVDERFKQVDERFKQVDERLNRLEQRVDRLERDIQKLNNQVGALRGESLELRYRNHIGNFFGRVLRRVRVVEIRSIEDELEPLLSDEAFEQLLNLDMIAAGKVKNHPNRPEIWLAIEISATINTNDITRARQRADMLCQVGYPTIAVAGGEECSLDAAALAQQTNVVIIQDGGQMTGWDEAFAPILPMLAE